MGKIALVTGASGFIGSRLIEDLGKAGFSVRALMRRGSLDHNLKGLNYSRIEGDLSDLDSLKRAVQGVSHIFHLAGAVTAPNRESFFKHNAEGTRNLAAAAATLSPGSLQRFVYVSSLAAGGPQPGLEPRTENQPDQPISAYGESKLQGEKEVLQFKNNFAISIIRPPMVYGPKDKATFIFVQTISRNILPMMGKKFYSLIHVGDLSRGIIQSGMVTTNQVASGEIFYIAADELTSYEGMMGAIAHELRRRPIKVPVPRLLMKGAAIGFTFLGRWTKRTYPLNLDKLHEIAPDFWICSNEKAKRVLGFQPEYDLNSGMADAIRWYRQQGWV